MEEQFTIMVHVKPDEECNYSALRVPELEDMIRNKIAGSLQELEDEFRKEIYGYAFSFDVEVKE